MQIKTVVGMYDSNTYVCEITSQHVLIIDSGASLADIIRSVGQKQVAAILITHEHFDHLTNCVAYAKHFQVPIYGTIEVLDNLKYYREELPDANNPQLKYPIVGYDPAITFHVIKDESPLVIQGTTIQPYICQGHSTGSLVYLLNGCLFTGDVLFARGIGNIFMTNGKKYLAASLDRLQNVAFQMAYHGHGMCSAAADQMKNITVWLKWLTR